MTLALELGDQPCEAAAYIMGAEARYALGRMDLAVDGRHIKEGKGGHGGPQFSPNNPDCNLRQGAGGMKIARNGSRTWFLR